MDVVTIIFVFFFGAVIGSFLNVCIYRLPRKISIVFPSSFCPACNNPVPPQFNIPIIGYIMLLGKCKFCGEKISFRYPLVEFITAVFAVFCLYLWPPVFAVVNFIFLAVLIVITFIDIDFQIIPDVISIPGTVLSAIVSYFIFDRSLVLIFLATLIGSGIFFIVGKLYEIIAKREGLGGGDVKLMAMFGAFLGLKAIPFIILLGSLTGTFVGLYLMIFKGKEKTFAIPFGPFLSFAAALYLFAGDKLINLYLSLFYIN